MRTERALERSANAGTQFELLYELSRSRLGTLALARSVGGREAGRPVVLRALPASTLSQLEVPLTRATSIAHPRLLKTLGVTRIDGDAYLVSEYVDGLPLVELARPMHAAATSVMPEVALRITLDALLAVAAAREELSRFGIRALPRCLYPDTAWVASFGETLLSDAGLAHELASARPSPGPDQESDVFAAGSLLWELLSGQQLSDGAPIEPLASSTLLPNPAPLLSLVSRAVTLDATQRFPSVEAMAEAIQELPVQLIGSDAEVRAAVEALIHSPRNSSVPEDTAPSGEHEIDPWDTPTRAHRPRHAPSRSSRVPDGTTQRPPVPTRTSAPARK